MTPLAYVISTIFILIVVILLGLKLFRKDGCEDECYENKSVWFNRSYCLTIFWIGIIVLIALVGTFIYDYYYSSDMGSMTSNESIIFQQLSCAKSNREKMKILCNNSAVVSRSPALQSLQVSLIDSINDSCSISIQKEEF